MDAADHPRGDGSRPRPRRAGPQAETARLTPALRLAADGVAQGGTQYAYLLLNIIEQLDRYSDPSAAARPDCPLPAAS